MCGVKSDRLDYLDVSSLMGLLLHNVTDCIHCVCPICSQNVFEMALNGFEISFSVSHNTDTFHTAKMTEQNLEIIESVQTIQKSILPLLTTVLQEDFQTVELYSDLILLS